MASCDPTLSLLAHYRALALARQECLLTAFVAHDGQLIDADLWLSAQTDNVRFTVRSLASRALALDAAALLIAHNHPGGDARPSKRDIEETRRLERVLFPLSVRLADHVIIAGGARFSFREAGLL